MRESKRLHKWSRERTQRVALRLARQSNGWSQAEVAEHIGTTFVNISRWERGLTTPSAIFRVKLCTLFDKNESELGLVLS